MAEKDYAALAREIVRLVGEEGNVKKVIHCQTRLRFNLKDNSAADEDGLKKTPGVLGVIEAGGQLQVVIGPDVDRAFVEVEKLVGKGGGKSSDSTVTDEGEADAPAKKGKLTWRSVGEGILDALSGSINPIIPVLVASAFFKMLTAVLGPYMANVLPTDSNLYILFNFVGDSCFYFFPVFLGYSSAKKFNVMPVLGILLGAIMLHPNFMALVGQPFDVFGIPCSVQNYSATVIPIILSVWIMSYISHFFDKILPDSIRSVFSPALTICVMLPITLCVVGPAGSFLSNYVVGGLLALRGISGGLVIIAVAVLYPFLVMMGMHMVLITAMLQIFATEGIDAIVSPGIAVESFAIMGVCIGAMLRIKEKEQRAMAAEFAMASIVAGTSEPCIYGICVRYKRPFLALIAGSAAGGLYLAITGVYSGLTLVASNFFAVLFFTGASTGNFVNGVVGCLLGAAVAVVTTYFFGFDKNEPAIQTDPSKQDVALDEAE